jgi:hypothetical protein
VVRDFWLPTHATKTGTSHGWATRLHLALAARLSVPGFSFQLIVVEILKDFGSS